ncbi:hypothetical protein ACRS2G_13040 [Staphylococcus epidermidis]|uniref:hypothetical protein n=1 Tax=Staphylococcus epidermidis TaxID=1282 RepID=UPI003EE38073
MSKEKFDKFHNIQQQLNKSKNTKIENEKKEHQIIIKIEQRLLLKKALEHYLMI